MKDYDANKDYYEILDISQATNQPEIKKAFHQLSLIWHPDKWSEQRPYPPNDQPMPKATVENRFLEIKEAYEVLTCAVTKSRYDAVRRGETFDPAPVAEHDRRNAKPSSKDVFFEWLREDAQKYPHNQSFKAASMWGERVRTNLWQLVDSGFLSYENFESDALNQGLLWHVVFNDDGVTQYVRDHLYDEPEGNPVDLIKLMEKYRTDYSYSDGVHVDFTKMESAWQRLSKSDEKFSHEERFLLYILRDRRTKEYASYVRISPLHKEHEPTRICSDASGLTDLTRQWMVDALKHYRSQQEAMSFNQLRLELLYLGKLIFFDYSETLDLIGTRIIQPIQEKIAALSKKKDAISQIKKEQLELVLGEINTLLCTEMTEWVNSNKKQPFSIKELTTTGFLEDTYQPQKIQLFEKAIHILDTYEKKKEIGRNANKIGAILKWIKSFALTVGSVGIAPLISQRVRDGLMGRPKTQEILRTCRQNMNKEKKEVMRSR